MDKFSIGHEPAIGLLRITLAGFWDAATAAAFEEALRESLRIWSAANRSVLIDARAYGVQSQEVMGRFKAIVAQVRRPGTRVAVLVGSALGKLQVQRVDPDATHRLFTSELESMDWLCGDR